MLKIVIKIQGEIRSAKERMARRRELFSDMGKVGKRETMQRINWDRAYIEGLQRALDIVTGVEDGE
jgi:hypothetical protein